MVAWDFNAPSLDADVFVSFSSDNGLVWSTEQAINPDFMTDNVNDSYPRISGDGAGHWVAVWSRSTSPAESHSADNGATWSTVASLGAGLQSGPCHPDIATDADGNWIATWFRDFGDERTSRVQFSMSVDNGSAWSVPASISNVPNDNAAASGADLAVLGPKHFGAAWLVISDSFGSTKGPDADLLYAETFDAGASWTPPSLLNSNGHADEKNVVDMHQTFASDGVGHALALWMSNDSLGGTIGEDWDIVSSASNPTCPTIPRGDCLQTTQAGSSRILLKDGGGGRDKLSWKWGKGQETTVSDLGSPLTSSSYSLCIYGTAGGTSQLIVAEDIPAARHCNGVPCWEKDGEEFTYTDKRSEQGAVSQMKFVAGPDGMALMAVKAKGPFLGLPSMPVSMATPIRVQLLNTETLVCWEGRYSSAAGNSGTTLKASSD